MGALLKFVLLKSVSFKLAECGSLGVCWWLMAISLVDKMMGKLASVAKLNGHSIAQNALCVHLYSYLFIFLFIVKFL